MQHHTSSETVFGLSPRIRVIVLFLAAGLLTALAAIFIFGVPIGTVGYYALFTLMMGSHFFMHAGHGQHSGHQQQDPNEAASTSDSQAEGEHTHHLGGCH